MFIKLCSEIKQEKYISSITTNERKVSTKFSCL